MMKTEAAGVTKSPSQTNIVIRTIESGGTTLTADKDDESLYDKIKKKYMME